MTINIADVGNTRDSDKLFTRKSLKLRKKAFSRNKIYVYCPVNKVEELCQLVGFYIFDLVINDYSVKSFSNKTICYYENEGLNKVEQKFLSKAKKFGAWVDSLINYLEHRLNYTEVSLIKSEYFNQVQEFSLLSKTESQHVKRILDVITSLLLLILTFPVMLITAIAIKLESSGPVLYKQKRLGLYNQEFEVIKFRSMRVNAEVSGAQWANINDTRVTRIGGFLRKSRIDELPQLFNVLKDEMSIVGPRPERKVFTSQLEKEIPYYHFRHQVKPGITGYAQVSYKYGSSIEDSLWKHKYDVHYIKHHSLWFDIKILFKTIRVVVMGLGR